MNLNCYIVDDEFHAIEILQEFIGLTPGLSLVGAAENPLVALREIQLANPDLIFLDVDMPEITGLAFAELVGITSLVVFTTAYREYALAAYERQVFDYLLKPITYERFLKCIHKAQKDFLLKGAVQKSELEFFYIKTGITGKLDKIELAEILYVEAAANYVLFYMTGEKHIAYFSISEVAAYLPAAYFSRIHKSFIVHHQAIQSLEPGQVRLKNGGTLPIGRSYKEAFSRKMGQLLFRSNRDA